MVTKGKTIMFEDGIYVRQSTLVVVVDGIGMTYDMNWWGDLAEWEIRKKEETETSTDYYDTVEEMFAGICGYHWTPDPDEIDFYPANELPFELDEFPPVNLNDPYATQAIYGGYNTPLMAWANDMGIINA